MRLFFAEIVPKTLVSSCFGVNFIVSKKISWDIFGKYNSVYVYKELSAAGVANQVLVLQISDKRREFFAVNGVPLFALNGVNFWFIPKFGGMNYYLLKYQ